MGFLGTHPIYGVGWPHTGGGATPYPINPIFFACRIIHFLHILVKIHVKALFQAGFRYMGWRMGLGPPHNGAPPTPSPLWGWPTPYPIPHIWGPTSLHVYVRVFFLQFQRIEIFSVSLACASIIEGAPHDQVRKVVEFPPIFRTSLKMRC